MADLLSSDEVDQIVEGKKDDESAVEFQAIQDEDVLDVTPLAQIG